MTNLKSLIILLIIWIGTGCSGATTTPDGVPAAATVTPAPALKPVTPQPTATVALDAAISRADAAATAALGPITLADGLITTMSKNEMDSDDILLLYQRLGGLAGIRSTRFTWSFHADGRVVSSDGRAWELTPAEITALVTGIAARGFFDLEQSYLPEDTCCDRAYHAITLNGADLVHSVVTLDGVANPPALEEALREINDLLFSLPQ